MPEITQQQIDEKSQQVVERYRQGDYEQALPLAIQVCDLTRRYKGEEHPDYVASLGDLALLYKVMGNYEAAEPLYRQMCEICRITLGEEHPGYAYSLTNWAILYQAAGKYDAAEGLYLKALEIYHKVLGVGVDNQYFASLINLVGMYRSTGNPKEAATLLKHELEIQLKTLGEEHPFYAISMNSLAVLYQAMGNYAEAEPLYRKVLEIRSITMGEKHPEYADSLNNLAVLYHTMRKYDAAEPLYRQALEIRRKTLGEEHPDYVHSLDNLAQLYHAIGDLSGAVPLYRKALKIRYKTLGEEHPDYVQSLNNLAWLYYILDDNTKAEKLFRQALELRRKFLGEENPDYIQNLQILSSIYFRLGNFSLAESLGRQELEIRRKTLGEDHPDYVQSLKNLALLYEISEDYATAEQLYRQALEIYRKTLGEEHSDSDQSKHLLATWTYERSLYDLARVYQMMGNYTTAEPLYRKAIEIGKDFPEYTNYVRDLNALAGLLAATNRAAEGMALMKKAAAIEDHNIGQFLSIGPEGGHEYYLEELQMPEYTFLSLVLEYLHGSGEAKQTAFNLVLRRKALGAEALAAKRDTISSGRYPMLQEEFKELTALRWQIAQKTLAGPGSENLQAYLNLLAVSTAQKQRLEGELAQQFPEMILEQKLKAVDQQAIAKALPEDSALVEFVRFDHFDFEAVPAKGEKQWKPAHYLAFVLLAGKPDNVQMIDLGKAEKIERLLAMFRASITGGERELPSEDRSQNKPYDQEGAISLRKAVFDPLLPALGDCRRLLLSPDGDLTRLPFEALPLGDDRYLIDEYHISYLSVGRDVLRFGVAAAGQPATPLVIADPDFDLGSQLDAAPAGQVRSYGRVSSSLDRGSLSFKRLPGTRVEGEHIAGLLGIQPWLGGEALEGRLKGSPSPRILHLATHGFFLEDQKRDPNQQRMGGEGQFGRLSYGMENPLLRSGLALAGVNTWLREKPLPDEAEDAILNAEDVSGLDLTNTELVVLSACETGLGEVQVGEGVFGLRRAFMLAGTKTLVMSLWKVPDQQTQELMEDFYKHLLNGEPRSEALREAQLAIKAKHPEPLYWGAFICQGETGPLKNNV